MILSRFETKSQTCQPNGKQDLTNLFLPTRRKKISKSRKIFSLDTGIRNLQIRNFTSPDMRPDSGALYENYVFIVLDQQADLVTSNHFYRTQAKTEIDFIINREEQYRLLEIKASWMLICA